MPGPVLTLLESSLRSWVGSRGFVIVLAAAIYPLFLTGAWIATHQGDVGTLSVDWQPRPVVEGENVTFTATLQNNAGGPVGPFVANLSVGTIFVAGGDVRFFPQETESVEVPGLAPGANTTVQLTWTAASAGAYAVTVLADGADRIPEVEEENNFKASVFAVHYKVPGADEQPAPAANLTGTPGAEVVADAAVAVEAVPEVQPGNTTTLRATVTNLGPGELRDARAVLRVGRVFNRNFISPQQAAQNMTLAAGQSATLELNWTAQQGPAWVAAHVQLPEGAHDPGGDNNHAARALAVQPVVSGETPPPPEKLTLKAFYREVLNVQWGLVLPLIALFYAAGIVAGEREAGNLPYLLTRPVRRWLIPLTRFAASFALVAGTVATGVVLTFLLLLGTPEREPSLLVTPLLISLLIVFAYGAVFALIGVAVDRPYLVGIAFVVGWERIVPTFFAPWVGNLTVFQHIRNAIAAWDPFAEGAALLPAGEEALRPFLVLLAAGAVFLAAAAAYMHRRDFDV